MRFEWDEDKNIENQIKHGIAFEEVVPMFLAGGYEIEFDSEHSTNDEDRFIATGKIEHHGMVFVVFIELEAINPLEDSLRIISARKLED